ncbi:MAG: glutaminyl-peptide cyclotransferase [Candidatus Omnitrophota bacterium]
MNVRHASIPRRSTSFSARITKVRRPAARGFRPEEVLFSPSSRCNLSCGHCEARQARGTLSIKDACRFLSECRKIGVERVGFTGGEPFLLPGFLCAVSRAARREGFLFDRIMTNGVWWRNEDDLKSILIRLYNSGYDGSICVSVDAFHRQSVAKVARFIELTALVWRRPDVISVAYTRGAKDAATAEKLRRLFALVGKIPGEIFVRTHSVEFSPVGRAAKYMDPWNGRWFREDFCRGPGNVFFVRPDGDVKPCCGYATDRKELSIGNIRTDSAGTIMKNVGKNRFVDAVFKKGLSGIRVRLESSGARFPGKTGSHCYFCDHVLAKVPGKVLAAGLAALLAFLLFASGPAYAQNLKMAKGYPRIRSKVVRKIAIPKWYHEGLFYEDKSLWLANGEKGDIWVIDTGTGEVTSHIKPVSDFPEALIRADDGSLLTTEWYDKKVYRVKIEDGRLVPEKEMSLEPSHPAGIVCAGGRIFVITWTRGLWTKFHLVELDKDLNVVNKLLIGDFQEPDQLAWDGKDLWISSWYTKGVYRVDIAKGEVTGFIRSPVTRTTGIAWDGKYMWVTGTYGDLYQLEIGENEEGA